MIELVRVLIVDDSAYVRKVIRQMLSRSPFIEVVGAARDGRDALQLAEELQPDVITCDLIMPELDGVGFGRAQMARHPIAIVVVSVASDSGELVLAALDAGAVDFVQKPTALATDRLLEIADELVEKVKEAARAHPLVSREPEPPAVRPVMPKHAFDIVVIGISTGGPQALKLLVPRLPADLTVPVAIVLHMPVGYTELYARKLNEQSSLTVLEAQGGEVIAPGHVHTRRRAATSRSAERRKQSVTYLTCGPSIRRTTVSGFVVSIGRGRLRFTCPRHRDDRMGSTVEGSAWIKAKGGTVLISRGELRGLRDAAVDCRGWPQRRRGQAGPDG